MFSVNIDKIAKMSSKEEDSFCSIADKIGEEYKTIGVVNGGVDSIKLATILSDSKEKVLFIDGDFRKDTFLGKYKLGKNIKGVGDAFADVSVLNDNICVTNNPYLDILFTGNIAQDSVNYENVKRVINQVSDKYEYIVVDSDEEAVIAKLCDATVLMCDEKTAENGGADIKVKELDDKGCFVLGVVVNE